MFAVVQGESAALDVVEYLKRGDGQDRDGSHLPELLPECDGAPGWNLLQPGSRRRYGHHFRRAQRDRRLDQRADWPAFGPPSNPPTVEPAAKRPGGGASLRSRTAPLRSTTMPPTVLVKAAQSASRRTARC